LLDLRAAILEFLICSPVIPNLKVIFMSFANACRPSQIH